jgi:hypothetical protein
MGEIVITTEEDTHAGAVEGSGLLNCSCVSGSGDRERAGLLLGSEEALG